MNQDQVLTCQHCRQDFAWTADQQLYFKRQGLKPPKFCPICQSALAEAKKDKFRGKLKKL